jgi:uncharacterized protein
MDKRLIAMLAEAKAAYEPEGFILLGVFGSRARGDFKIDSDLDILYRLDETFLDRYDGWGILGRLEEIKEELTGRFGLRVDMANERALHTISRKYILPETVYVA